MRLLTSIHSLAQTADRMMADALGESGLTPRQAIILSAIDEVGEILQTDMIKSTGIDRSTLSDVLRRMIRHGLIIRVQSRTNTRALMVTLTAKGRTALKMARTSADKVEKELRRSYPKLDTEITATNAQRKRLQNGHATAA